jgi:5-formyltetrahydrofolate cyclo-ligase
MVPRLMTSDLKSQLRREALLRRDGLDIDERLAWDAQICARVLALPMLAGNSGPVSGYWPIRSEADPRPILEALSAAGVATCLPVPGPDGLIFRAWSPWEPLVPAGFGTLAPPDGVAVVRPCVLLMPLAAFDCAGHRIGYGKGHYDRALAAMSTDGGPRPITIGLAYAAQEVPHVPAETHDWPLDVIVTPEAALIKG